MTGVDLTPPPHLSEPARAAWQGAIEAMAAQGTLDRASLPLIERYAVAWARWRDAEAQLAASGVIVTAPKSGVSMISVWHSIARTAAAQCTKAEIELGLSPARRGAAVTAARPLQADGSPGSASVVFDRFRADRAG